MSNIFCKPRELPRKDHVDAAKKAIEINAKNKPEGDVDLTPADDGRIAVRISKYWGPEVDLSVYFMDTQDEALKKKILQHLNAWGDKANICFRLSNEPDATVRIAREPDGYWSYLGTDVLLIPKHRQTMNLEGFTVNTSDEEYARVVRHEAGHTLGFPHEHMRKQLVERLDEAKTIAAFMYSQGWTEEEVRAQVLTPLDQNDIFGTPADQTSIMCYQLPAYLTKDGQPIPGGLDINDTDHAFAGLIYPQL